FTDVPWNTHVLEGREFGKQIVELKYETHVLVPKAGQLRFILLIDNLSFQPQTATVWDIQTAHNVQQGTSVNGLPKR
ncbi:MAG: hypothetical protein AAFQ98_24780, partial [Bacteroidota bacterium]